MVKACICTVTSPPGRAAGTRNRNGSGPPRGVVRVGTSRLGRRGLESLQITFPMN